VIVKSDLSSEILSDSLAFRYRASPVTPMRVSLRPRRSDRSSPEAEADASFEAKGVATQSLPSEGEGPVRARRGPRGHVPQAVRGDFGQERASFVRARSAD
jgi:hypothetical protein